MVTLDRATNLWGKISPEFRRRIERYLDRPTERGWNEIHGYVIRCDDGYRTVTLWQAVVRIDTSFMDIGLPYGIGERPRWRKWPDAMLVARAIRDLLAAPSSEVRP